MSVITNFRVDGNETYCERYGNGHINETYKAICGNKAYILQKINKNIFTNPAKLMDNIAAVCHHLSSKADDPREVLSIVPANDGKNYFIDEKGDYWRVYDFVTDSICLEKVELRDDFYQSAVGFGNFQRMLADFPADTLYETIKDFHNTPDRFRKFNESLKKDACGRAAGVQKEIEFVLSRENTCHTLIDMLDSGDLPLRVTHNDTKLNNVLLDKATRKALCVIDLDTVMPGLAAYDFGDSIRFGATSAAEDEKDISKVNFVPELFATYSEGYLGSCGKALLDNEIETLPEGAITMTLECGMRFLTDYLDGDTYFRTAYAEHNLVRCRTQFKLVSDMEAGIDGMKKTVRSFR